MYKISKQAFAAYPLPSVHKQLRFEPASDVADESLNSFPQGYK